MFNFLDKEGLMYLVLKIKKLITDANVKIATKDTAGIIKGGDNHIAEDGTLTLITETTETTMLNSNEGRMLFKEIVGKTEKLTSTGKNLLNLRDGVNAVGDGVTYTNRGDGTYSRVGTATGITGNAWLKGGYVEGVPSTEITNPIMTLKLGKSYFIGDCILFSVTKNGVSYGVTGAVTVQNEDVKVVGIRNTGQLVGHSYNDVIYPRVFEGLVDLGWEPYGVGIPFIRSTVISGIKTYDGNGNESSIALSQPIELNKVGDVQDVIVDEKPIRRITKKRITSNMAIVNNPDWANKQAFVIESFFSDGLQVYDAGFSTVANILCTHAPTSSAVEIAGGSVMDGVAQNMYTNLFFSFENCATLDAVKTFLDNNVVEVYYELATPITSLPTADQVALNSVKTFDGTTHLEFNSLLQPEFVAEYGTSKVGGVALEAKGESQANSENIEEMNSVLEAMNTILQNAFVPKGTTSFVGDINLCVESGIYRIGSDISNAPYGNGFLIVFAWLPNVLIQVNMAYLPNYTAVRTCWYGTWNPWYRITTTEIK